MAIPSPMDQQHLDRVDAGVLQSLRLLSRRNVCNGSIFTYEGISIVAVVVTGIDVNSDCVLPTQASQIMSS